MYRHHRIDGTSIGSNHAVALWHDGKISRSRSRAFRYPSTQMSGTPKAIYRGSGTGRRWRNLRRAGAQRADADLLQDLPVAPGAVGVAGGAAVNVSQYVANPGYVNPQGNPTKPTTTRARRDSRRVQRTDAISYSYSVAPAAQGRCLLQAQILNLPTPPTSAAADQRSSATARLRVNHQSNRRHHPAFNPLTTAQLKARTG